MNQELPIPVSARTSRSAYGIFTTGQGHVWVYRCEACSREYEEIRPLGFHLPAFELALHGEGVVSVGKTSQLVRRGFAWVYGPNESVVCRSSPSRPLQKIFFVLIRGNPRESFLRAEHHGIYNCASRIGLLEELYRELVTSATRRSRFSKRLRDYIINSIFALSLDAGERQAIRLTGRCLAESA